MRWIENFQKKLWQNIYDKNFGWEKSGSIVTENFWVRLMKENRCDAMTERDSEWRPDKGSGRRTLVGLVNKTQSPIFLLGSGVNWIYWIYSKLFKIIREKWFILVLKNLPYTLSKPKDYTPIGFQEKTTIISKEKNEKNKINKIKTSLCNFGWFSFYWFHA